MGVGSVADAWSVTVAGVSAVTAVANAARVTGLTPPATPHTDPVVVCVPARDEADVIAALIDDLRAQRGVTDLRVIVYDDESTDDTAAIARRAVDGDERFAVVDGHASPAPTGWTGKAWALDRATRHGDGRHPLPTRAHLCLVDADVRLAPDALAAAVTAFAALDGSNTSTRLGLLSVWPAQVTGSVIESLVQPLLFWSWFSLLPQALTETDLRTSTAVANGQFLVTRLDRYLDVGGHRSVAAEPADDIALARTFRRAGLRTVNRSGQSLIRCRMYRTGDDLRAGYRRWTATEFGGTRGSYVAVGAMAVAHVGPLVRAAVGPRRRAAVAALTLSAVSRVVARRVETGSLDASDIAGALAHPASMAVASWIVIDSARHTRAGTLRWKGRSIS